MDEQGREGNRTYLRPIFVILAPVIVVLLLIYALTSFTPLNQSGSIMLSGTLVSSVLSAILIYFYFTMKDIQRRQTDISNLQANIARSAEEPRIFLQYWFVFEGSIEMLLSNFGGGIATNITSTVCIQPVNIENSYELVSHHPIEEHRQVLKKKSSDQEDILSNILEPGEKNVTFSADIHPVNCFTAEEEPEGLTSPEYLFRQLDLKGVNYVIVSVVISYNDILGTTHDNTIWTAVVPYSGEDKISDLLSKEVYELGRERINLIKPEGAPDQYKSSGDKLLYSQNRGGNS